MLKLRLPGFTAQYSLCGANEGYHMARAAACVGSMFINSVAPMLGVTTDECLAKGLCAYVDTKGHVTCGRCPGQNKFAALDFAATRVANSFAGFGRVG